MYTHKQERTNREEGLENIIESMYTPTSEGYTPPEDPNYKGDKTREPALAKGPKCTHPGCTDGKHADGSTCSVCKGTGHLPFKEDDYVPPHDEDKLKRAKKRGFDNDIDHHNQYMMNQDLLQPIHQAASIATDGEAKNFNEWLIIQIKDQGDHWVDWFIETVIVEERFRD